MKVIRIVERIMVKAVVYFDMPLIVPVDATHIAVDTDGSMFAYQHKPTCDAYPGEWASGNGMAWAIAMVDLEGMNWRDTLQSV